jgi:hypothetical protein
LAQTHFQVVNPLILTLPIDVQSPKTHELLSNFTSSINNNPLGNRQLPAKFDVAASRQPASPKRNGGGSAANLGLIHLDWLGFRRADGQLQRSDMARIARKLRTPNRRRSDIDSDIDRGEKNIFCLSGPSVGYRDLVLTTRVFWITHPRTN